MWVCFCSTFTNDPISLKYSEVEIRAAHILIATKPYYV